MDMIPSSNHADCRQEQLTSPETNSHLWEVLYSYDYMSGCPDPSIFAKVAPDGTIKSPAFFKLFMKEITPKINANSIPLHPKEAGLPWHTSLNIMSQNKHWKPAIALTSRLLELFAADETARNSFGRKKKSYADIAQAEIGHVHDSWGRFSAYLWPAADQQRLELLAATLVFIMIFDDVWEMNEDDTIHKIQVEYISRLKPADASAMCNMTPLQALISNIVWDIHNEDKWGNGGKEVIEGLIDFCNHPPPPKHFTTLREFLDYRIQDAGMPYVLVAFAHINHKLDADSSYNLACIKFSLGSNLDIGGPRIAHFVSLVSDHVCYANDLASFDKEKEAYVNGDVLYLINVVDMVQKVFNLPDSNSAKSAALAIQLEIERQIVAELSRLRASNDVTSEEFEYVEGLVYLLVGNIFTSVVSCRYGGEQARLCTTL
ncbi:LOW QUALITY PROTEIN: hypothetical protein CVT25_014192 [Psilocybe cyanescens]|uniref:Terpene synthase n=1 Tax=Psilocybe cyanescens TaxID=93625 RepID=A0A409XGE2_PSICY|nr:LOW QUALITY PROTEIN: hypothetical protein CVT25_014192 [Psilocybe cyanescens]